VRGNSGCASQLRTPEKVRKHLKNQEIPGKVRKRLDNQLVGCQADLATTPLQSSIKPLLPLIIISEDVLGVGLKHVLSVV